MGVTVETALEAARRYLARGWVPVPILRGEKGPHFEGWPIFRPKEAELPRYFPPGSNIGLLLGERSGGLVDVDLDSPEAIAIAPTFLPKTGLVHGRANKARSHYWYLVGPVPKSMRFNAPLDGKCLVELRSTGQQTLVPPSVHPSAETIQWDLEGEPARLAANTLQSALGRLAACALIVRRWPEEGGRHDAAMALGGFLLRHGWTVEDIQRFVIAAARTAGDEEAVARGQDVLDTAEALAAGRTVTGGRTLIRLLGKEVVDRVVEWLKLDGNRADGRRAPLAPPEEPWPTLAPEAYHGLAGDIVKTIEPYSEADPVAVLIHVLTAFGNIVGAKPYFRVEFTRHYLRFYVVVVGETAKARKGTSWSAARHLFRQVDPEWGKTRVTSGLSSGEGLIYAVRDPIEESKAVREKGRVKGFEMVTSDRGVQDKRLLVVEEEFCQALKVMNREGNILSPIVRQAWDSGDLNPLTKNNPIRATGAHISIVGHTTREELLQHLNETEQANGFANRFIWLQVRRSKAIPEPTGVPEELLARLIARLHQAVDFARGVGEIQRDETAREIWATVYPQLSEGRPRLLGAILARAEAQVMRLACIYALFDCSSVVCAKHLKAALALWDFSEACARRIFGDRLGQPVADRILAALQESGELSETDIRDLFQRHRSFEIDQALALLLRLGLAERTTEETGGRPRRIWRLATKAT